MRLLASVRAEVLSLFRAVAVGAAVASDFPRDRATAAPDRLGYRSKTAAVLQAGLNLVSLSLGQSCRYPICSSLWSVKAMTVPAAALLPLPGYTKVLQLLSEFRVTGVFLNN